MPPTTVGLERGPHTLKGTVAIFGAESARELAESLETMGRKGEMSGARESLAELEKAVHDLMSALREYVREWGSSTRSPL